MAILSSSNNVDVLVSSKANTKGVDDTGKSFQKLENDADRVNTKMVAVGSTIGGLAAGAITKATAAVKDLAINTIASAAGFEQTRIGLENMLGSADIARKLLSDVSKFAADTPFEFPELAGATKQLVAFGFTGEAAFDTMKQLGDVSAAIGAPIGDLSYLMGTLRTQGRAFTVDIRQFAQRGVPIYEYLAKVLKTDEAAMAGLIEEGKVGFPEVQKAFEMMTGEGGKFHGAMEKQSKSLSGLWSTLQDNIGQAGRELLGINSMGDIAEGSLFDMMRDSAGDLIKVLPAVTDSIKSTAGAIAEIAGQIAEYLGPKVAELVKAFGEDLGPLLSDLWQNVLSPLAMFIGTTLVFALGAVIDIATGLVKAIGFVYEKVKEGDPVWTTLVIVLGTVATALTMNAAFTAFTAGMALITTTTIPTVTAAFTSLAALITAPIIMPAIAVGAAIASLVLVYDQAQKTLAAIDEANASKANFEEGQIDVQRKLNDLRKNGTPEQKARAISTGKKLGLPGFATGVRNFSGGLAIVGERGPELVNLPQGSDVHTNQESKQMMKSSGGNTYYIDNVNLTTPESTREFFKINDQDARNVKDGLTPSRGVA